MRHKKDVKRFWINEAGLIVRPWFPSEYKYCNPHEVLVDRSWYVYCPACGKFLDTVGSEDEAKRYVHYCDKCRYKDVKKNYPGYECGKITLRTVEFGYEYYEELRDWVHYCKSYWKKDK